MSRLPIYILRKRLPKYDKRRCHYSLVFAKVFTKNICGVFVILYIKRLIPVMLRLPKYDIKGCHYSLMFHMGTQAAYVSVARFDRS